MADSNATDGVEMVNHGWRVTMAGLGINLALGVLYSWSVISGAINDAGWGWTQAERSLPYSVACLVFCLVMVPAGRMQDKLSPRLVATIGGVLVGAGMIFASMTKSPMGYVIGFGVLAGAGIGFGYASATPPAVKWFPPAKTGMIAGLVVSGFGLASVYAAPLARWLSNTWDLKVMMMSLGIGFLVVVVGLAQVLKAPHRAVQMIKGLGNVGAQKQHIQSGGEEHGKDYSAGEMMKTPQFWMLWFMYACGAGAGLMVISVCKKINAGAGVGIAAVVALAIGNGGGRILAGMVSDKLGRQKTLFGFLVLQACAIVALAIVADKTLNAELKAAPEAVAQAEIDVVPVGTNAAAASAEVEEADSGLSAIALVMVLLSAVVGANYGSNLALFPSMTKDYYGLKNFGMNYGLVFTAWGIGGFVLAMLAAKVYDKTKSFTFAFYCSAALLVLAAIMTFAVKPPKKA